jgi:cytochrome P450
MGYLSLRPRVDAKSADRLARMGGHPIEPAWRLEHQMSSITERPAHVPVDRVLDWDYINDPDFAPGPHTAFDKLRNRPAFWSPRHGGHWVITDPERIRDALQDPATFSNDTTAIPGNGLPTGLIPVELDPPEHGLYRSMLAPLFSPREAVRMTDLVRDVITETVDAVAGRGRCEFLHDVAMLIPARLFFRWMDLPEDYADRMGALVHTLTARDMDISPRRAGAEIHAFLREQVEQREKEPGEDLISQFFAATVDGRPPTVDEVYDITYLLFIAGLDTTSGVLSFIFRHLARHPEQREWLLDSPERLKPGVEELIRRHAISNNVRRVRHDTQFAGVELKTDDLVLLPMTLANGDRDEDAPLDAAGARANLAFGGGVHRCLGSHLARLEMTAAVEIWHARIPEYRLETDEPVGFGGPIMGLHKVPLVWN